MKGVKPGSTTVVVIGLFLLALGVRLMYNHQLAPHPFSETLVIDALDEDAWGREIAAGNWLGKGRGVFYRDPLYAYLLGVFYSVFGHDLPGVRALQAILDSLSVVLVSLVASRVFSANAGVLSGLLAALYGPFVFNQGLIMKTSLTITLLAAFLWCGLLAAERASPRLWFLAGLFFALGMLTRGNFVLLTPVAVLMSFLWRGPSVRPAKRSRQMLLFVAGLALVLVPDAARNGIYGGSFTFMVPSAGLNFFHGNNPSALGVHSRIPLVRTVPEHEEADARRIAEHESGRKLGPSEVSSYWMGRGLDFVFHQPGSYLKLLGRKALLFWNAYEVPDVYNYQFFARASPVLGLLLTFAVVGPLGLTGMVFSAGNRRAWVLIALVIVFMGSVVGFYITDRYRLPVVALLIPFAAQALLELVGSLRARAYRRLTLIIGCLVFSSLLVNVKLVPAAHFLSQSHTLLGTIHYEEERLDEAEEEYRAALRIEPDNAMASNNLAFVIATRGRSLEEALRHAVDSVRLDPNSAASFDTLAFIYHAMGRKAEAEQAIRQAIALAPDDPALRERLQEIQGRPDGALPPAL